MTFTNLQSLNIIVALSLETQKIKINNNILEESFEFIKYNYVVRTINNINPNCIVFLGFKLYCN